VGWGGVGWGAFGGVCVAEVEVLIGVCGRGEVDALGGLVVWLVGWLVGHGEK